MRGRKLCLITHKIQPEMLAARGTNDSLQKNAWIQSSKHALTEECCLELPRMAVQQSGCTATPSQQALPGLESGLRQKEVGYCQKLGHVIGVASVAVGTKLALAVIVGISVGFSRMDWVRGSSVTQKVNSTDR